MNGPNSNHTGTTWRRRNYGSHIAVGDSLSLEAYLKDRSAKRRGQAIRAPAKPSPARDFSQSNPNYGRIKRSLKSAIVMPIKLFQTLFAKEKERNMQRKAEQSPAGQRVKALQDEIDEKAEQIKDLTNQVVEISKQRKG
jgi:hypothetical protein